MGLVLSDLHPTPFFRTPSPAPEEAGDSPGLASRLAEGKRQRAARSPWSAAASRRVRGGRGTGSPGATQECPSTQEMCGV
jgi:hypothetical protein